jgi:SAM-dependent methyltransferase
VFSAGVIAYWGIDLYSEELHRLHTANVYGDAARLPFADTSVDTVLALPMLGYIEDPQTVLREVRRVLRPGGNLVLTYSQSGGAAGPSDFYRFTESFYRVVLQKHGFEIEVLEARTGTIATIGETLSTAVYYRGKTSRLRMLGCFLIQKGFGFIDRLIYLPHGGIGHIVVARKGSR